MNVNITTKFKENTIYKLLYLLSVMLLLGGVAGAQAFITPPVQASGYHLDFTDNFQNFDLSPDGFGVHRWYNGIWFDRTPSPKEQVDHAQGYLSLHWHQGQKSNGTSITTMSRDAQHSRAWCGGYFEARMRWKPELGAFPAFWLIPVEDANGKALQGGVRETGEIDIFEGQGDRPHDFYATVHHWINGKDVENNGSNNRFSIPWLADFSDWHTYGLLWTANKLTWFFDDKPIHSEPVYPILNQQHYYLVLSQQVGSWRNPQLKGMQAVDTKLDVQWVRIWQK